MKENKPEYQTEADFIDSLDIREVYRLTDSREKPYELLSKYKQHLIDNAPSKWISIDDRLPVNGSWILSFDEERGRHISWFDKTNGWKDRSNKKLNTVTHWQPLPAAPDQYQLEAVVITDEEMEHLWNICPYNDARQSYKWMQEQLNPKP